MATTGRAIDEQGNVYLSADVTYGNYSWKFTIDPLSVQEFKLDVEFDESRAELDQNYFNGGIKYLPPFVEMYPPDFTGLDAGLLQNIHGEFYDGGQGGEVPLGEVDVVTISFIDKYPGMGDVDKVGFRVFASEDDFVKMIDPFTKETTEFVGPEQIQEAKGG